METSEWNPNFNVFAEVMKKVFSPKKAIEKIRKQLEILLNFLYLLKNKKSF